MFKYNEFFIWNFNKIKYQLFCSNMFLIGFKNYFFLNLLRRRLELFSCVGEHSYHYFVIKTILQRFKPLTLYFYKNYFTSKILLHIYIKFKINSYAGYRHFLGLPINGNRTWSNHKMQKKNNIYFYNYYRVLFFKKYKNYCIRSRERVVIYLEFVNWFWYHQFKDEWMLARNKRIEFEKKKSYINWYYDTQALLANRVCVFLEKNKKNKKKIKIKPNFFNVGFVFLFTRQLQSIIFKNFNLVKKK